MANKTPLGLVGDLEFEIRTPHREELQQVIDLVNADDSNMPLETLHDIYHVDTEGFKVAVDKHGNVLSKRNKN